MALAEVPEPLVTALGAFAETLSMPWLERPPACLLGGSCGLLLHGVGLNAAPQDIDLYADLEDAERLHDALGRYAVSGPQEDYSGGCFSLRSCYSFGHASIELICGFEIGHGSRKYSVDIERLLAYAPVQYFTGIGLLRLMPAAHELIFNMLRGKSERCECIAAYLRHNLSDHLPLLQSLILDNGLDLSFQLKLNQMLGVPPLIQT
ncbi:hypothetical protein D3C76_333880 [compost metagenome]